MELGNDGQGLPNQFKVLGRLYGKSELVDYA